MSFVLRLLVPAEKSYFSMRAVLKPERAGEGREGGNNNAFYMYTMYYTCTSRMYTPMSTILQYKYIHVYIHTHMLSTCCPAYNVNNLYRKRLYNYMYMRKLLYVYKHIYIHNVFICIPLNTESRAMPQPVTPPPITSTSYTSPLRSLANCSDLRE